MPDAVIVSARRTPIGKYLGSFADLTAAQLGTVAVKAAAADAGLGEGEVDELFFGNGRQAGGGPNVARQVAVGAGLGHGLVATTLNQACASGLKSIVLAAQEIQLGQATVAIAGGTESMSGLPFLLPGARRGYRLGHAKMVDAMYQDGFCCPLSGMVMGETAEKLAAKYGVGREAQDAYALQSQLRAAAAIGAGRFADELAPVEVPGRKGAVTVVAADEHVRPQTTLASLAKLPTVFAAETPSVTPGNASGITDGAAALVLMSADEAARRGLEPLARIEGHASAGVDPSLMGIGPVPATRRLAERVGRQAAEYDLVELNEAFAAQVLACQEEMAIPTERLNVNGGAIALGHPIGATGARIVVTLLHELRRRDGKTALATLCVSGGLGVSVAFARD